MTRPTLRLAAAAAGTTMAFALAPTAGASPTVDKPEYIVGGSQASNPSVVQLVFTQDGGQYGCTGEVIAALS